MNYNMEAENINQILSLLGYNVKEQERSKIANLIHAKKRVSPRLITSLDSDEIFVFGSDITGIHNGRASKLAVQFFGAKKGQGEGPQGQSYAIPTTEPNKMPNNITLPLEEDTYLGNMKRARDIKSINTSIQKFINYARNTPSKKFLVSRIGVGFAGFTDEEIAEMFHDALYLENVYLPQSFLDVLFCVKPDFVNPSEWIPTNSCPVNEFQKLLEQQLSLYCLWLREHYVFTAKDKTLKIMDNVEKICNAIIQAVDMMYRGLPANAYYSIKIIMDKLFPNDEELMKSVEADKTFYRMRVESNSWIKKTIDKRGMFHIPYSLRNLVSTQRYSVPGYPCLYLGEHVYGCWEEVGRHNMNDCLISKLVSKKTFFVLDMRVPDPMCWHINPNSQAKVSPVGIENLILLFPLIIASTFKVYNQSSTFKPEYIVPQLLLQYIKERAYKESHIHSKERKVYGICYTSVNSSRNVKNSSDFIYTNKLFDNYVIPVIDIHNEICSTLSSLFYITPPICEDYLGVSNYNFERSPSITEYKNTRWGQLEEILGKKEPECVF